MRWLHPLAIFFLGRPFTRPTQFKSKKEFEILPLSQNKSCVGHKLRYDIKVVFGEISLKLRQTNWSVARIDVDVVVDALPSQTKFYTCSTIDIWTHINAVLCTSVPSAQNGGLPVKLAPKVFDLLWTPLARRKALSETYTMHVVSC
jgi:hypothetical protein